MENYLIQNLSETECSNSFEVHLTSSIDYPGEYVLILLFKDMFPTWLANMELKDLKICRGLLNMVFWNLTFRDFQTRTAPYKIVFSGDIEKYICISPQTDLHNHKGCRITGKLTDYTLFEYDPIFCRLVEFGDILTCPITNRTYRVTERYQKSAILQCRDTIIRTTYEEYL